jgi:hypothetical protein
MKQTLRVPVPEEPAERFPAVVAASEALTGVVLEPA